MWSFPGGTKGKKPACQLMRHKRRVQSLGWEDTLEEGMATSSSILSWRIPWTEEPGGLQVCSDIWSNILGMSLRMIMKKINI